MALRGAAGAAASASCRRQRNPSIFSISNHLTTKFRNPPPHHPKTLWPFPLYQPVLQSPIRAVSQVRSEPVSKKQDEEQSPKNWKIKMLYDGDCPLCMREVNMLRERNKRHGTIKFVDISSEDYSPEENEGLDYQTVMGRIHAILSDGTVVTDVEAFRRLYEQVGLGWIYAITKYEPIATIADNVYGVWAKYRLQITGRPPIEDILEARKKKGEVCRDNNACKMEKT
ncbi:hypothetical protein L6164_014670 [Bauhinia variegata]|uniref:Uncharacterized protein n=1 Tax=Bauhinia variegata TaxID=167791 RepID=A0ACB9NJT4_BAUVA|nr:hypothetical protein L6164_014670 [Bauhinia variegata]